MVVKRQEISMLKERDLDNKPAGRFAYAAAIDADRYSDECRVRFSPQERAQIETFKDIVTLAYSSENCFVNFRKTMAVIKLVNPLVRDRQMLRELDEICVERGYEKVRSAQGLLIRMPRK
jgi:hypothetical protein